MSVNGSEFIQQPWDTMWSPFIDVFGAAFWFIPIGIVAAALFMKTREITVTSVWLTVSCLLAGSTMFNEHPEISYIYLLFAGLGIVGTIVSLYFMKE
jgi:hypothetical protein